MLISLKLQHMLGYNGFERGKMCYYWSLQCNMFGHENSLLDPRSGTPTGITTLTVVVDPTSMVIPLVVPLESNFSNERFVRPKFDITRIIPRYSIGSPH